MLYERSLSSRRHLRVRCRATAERALETRLALLVVSWRYVLRRLVQCERRDAQHGGTRAREQSRLLDVNRILFIVDLDSAPV